MFKLNLGDNSLSNCHRFSYLFYSNALIGDTPNNLTDEEFRILGERAEGYSGSDIAVVVREALMEPLRKCQVAKQFLRDQQGNYHPCEEYPNCAHCPMDLSAGKNI